MYDYEIWGRVEDMLVVNSSRHASMLAVLSRVALPVSHIDA